MASKTEMLPHLAVEARCSPSLTIIVGHLPLDKFAVSFASFCILLPADEHRWTCLHCFHVPIWHLKANTFVEAKFSNEADAKQRCLGAWSLHVLAVNTQSSTWRKKPRHTLWYVVKMFSSLCKSLISEQISALLAFLTGPGINSWKPWRWITDDYGAMYCCSVKGYSIIYIIYYNQYYSLLLCYYKI